MVTQEEWMDIQFMKRQGMTISEIARETGRSRKTIRKYLERGEAPRYGPRTPRPPVLEPYKEGVSSLFHKGIHNAVVLYERISELGYPGSYTVVKRFIAPLREEVSKPKATLRFETKPGEQSQVDWGHFKVFFEKTGRSEWRYLFLMILGWSRYRAGCFLRSQDTEHFLWGHQRAFAQVGGITETMLYDNLKSVVLLRKLRVADSKWNPHFLDFASHYGFFPRLHLPGRPQTKGKVENQVGFVRSNFFCGRRFWDDEDLNRQFLQWLDRVNAKPHGTTKEAPVQRLKLEREALLPTEAAHAYPVYYRETRRVPKDCLVSWRGSKYSVPIQFVGKTVEVKERVDGQVLELYYLSERIAEHRKTSQKGQWSIDTTHFQKLISLMQVEWDPPNPVSDRSVPDDLEGSYPLPDVATRDLAVYEQVIP